MSDTQFRAGDEVRHIYETTPLTITSFEDSCAHLSDGRTIDTQYLVPYDPNETVALEACAIAKYTKLEKIAIDMLSYLEDKNLPLMMNTKTFVIQHFEKELKDIGINVEELIATMKSDDIPDSLWIWERNRFRRRTKDDEWTPVPELKQVFLISEAHYRAKTSEDERLFWSSASADFHFTRQLNEATMYYLSPDELSKTEETFSRVKLTILKKHPLAERLAKACANLDSIVPIETNTAYVAYMDSTLRLLINKPDLWVQLTEM